MRAKKPGKMQKMQKSEKKTLYPLTNRGFTSMLISIG